MKDPTILENAVIEVTTELNSLVDLLADSRGLRVRETPAVARLNALIEQLDTARREFSADPAPRP